MILIIGGAYQGKQSYASKTYNLTGSRLERRSDLHDRRSAKQQKQSIISTPLSAENWTKEDQSGILQK